MDKQKDTGKPPKTPKGFGRDPPGTCYNMPKLSGAAGQGVGEDMLATPAIFHTQPEDVQPTQDPSDTTDQTLPDMEEDEEGDEADQPTLAEILREVHKCTALVHTLQEYFGGLKEELGFIRHDLRTTAGEGRISKIEDKLTLLLRDTQITARLARVNKLKSDDIENHLRRNNICIVGLPEKTEGRRPTEFAEKWLLDVFGKEVFTQLG